MSADAVIKLVLQYVDQLIHLIAGPRAFFREIDPSARSAVTAALTFLLFSMVIAFVIRLPFITGEGDAWRQLPVMLVFYSATAVTLGCLACLVMRVFGGKAPLPGHVVVFSYFAGLSVLLFTLTTVIAKSLIRLRAPEAAGETENYVRAVLGGGPDLDAPRFAAVSDSPEVAWTMLILLAGQLVIAFWLVICWRAMAELNARTTLQSYLALGLFLAAGYLVARVLGMVQKGAGLALF